MKRTSSHLCVTIDEAQQGKTVEAVLRQFSFTKTQIKRMKFLEDGLRLNGERVRINAVVSMGDLLEIPLKEASASDTHLEEIEMTLEILYEDEDLLAVWKPAGMVLHPSDGHYKDTLSNAVQTYYQKQNRNVSIRSIGRLDKDTSGIVVFALNQVSAARLWKQKEDGVFTKEYLAWCEGRIDTEGNWKTIDTRIGKVADNSIKMQISADGKSAVTHYQSIKQSFMDPHGIPCTLLRVQIETGRTHQIRLHLSSIGYPLVGDPLYGSGKTGTDGARLCAWKTDFLQPFSNIPIHLEKHL